MNVKIADFGLAGITTPFSGNLRQLCGTPEFTAPEIVQGKEYSGPAVDIWSLGVILYELLQAGPTHNFSKVLRYNLTTRANGSF